MTNHGVPAGLDCRCLRGDRKFYARPVDEKRRFNCSGESQFLGYRGLGAEKSRMHAGGEACKQYRIGNVGDTAVPAGLAEFYHQPFNQGTLLFGELALGRGPAHVDLRDKPWSCRHVFDRFMEAPMHRFGLNFYISRRR